MRNQKQTHSINIDRHVAIPWGLGLINTALYVEITVCQK